MKGIESKIINSKEIINIRQSKSFPNSPIEKELRGIGKNEKYDFGKELSERIINPHKIPRNLLITISIELSEGNEVSIPIYKGQNAEEVAINFCNKYNLSDDIIPPLIEAINQKIEEGGHGNFHPESLDTEEIKNIKEKIDHSNRNIENEIEEVQESSRKIDKNQINNMKIISNSEQKIENDEDKQALKVKDISHALLISKSQNEDDGNVNCSDNEFSEKIHLSHPPGKIFNIELSNESSSQINDNNKSKNKEKSDHNLELNRYKNNSSYFIPLKHDGPLLSPQKPSKPRSELNTEPHIPTEVANESFEQWQNKIIKNINNHDIQTIENEEVKKTQNNENSTNLKAKLKSSSNYSKHKIIDPRKYVTKKKDNEIGDEIDKLKLKSKYANQNVNDFKNSVEKSEKENYKAELSYKNSYKNRAVAQTIKGKVGENASSRLYNAGMKKLMIQENMCKENELQTIEHNMLEATFRPKISFNPRLNIRRSSANIGIHLLKTGEKIKEKKEQNRAYNNLLEQNKHTFKPKISRKSSRMAFEKNRTLSMEISQGSSRGFLNKFDILYEDAVRRKELNDKINAFDSSECTFKPRITGHSRALSQSQREKLSLLERLQIPIGIYKNTNL